MTTVVDRGLQQRLDALAEANRVRSARCALKRGLREGSVRFSEAVVDPAARSMTVWGLVLSVRWFGPVRVRGVLRRVGVLPSKEVGCLTDRQRSLLVELVEGGAA